jgi:hypothetical protein
MVLAHAILAAAETDPAFAGKATLYVVAIVVPILTLIVTVVALGMSHRRQPPVAEEMHKSFVPRAEYNEGIQRVHERIDKTSEDITAARSQFAKAFGDLEHAIGRLEGKMDGMR